MYSICATNYTHRYAYFKKLIIVISLEKKYHKDSRNTNRFINEFLKNSIITKFKSQCLNVCSRLAYSSQVFPSLLLWNNLL